MELEKILNTIEEANLNSERFSRRNALKHAGNTGLKIALAAVPAALASVLSKKAYAFTDPTIVDVLNFALTLEYLESKFYVMGLNSGIIPAADQAVFTQIANHEASHVTFLFNTIEGIQGGAAISSPVFDFTAGGTYPDVFTNYQTFLALSQSFEDLGVRAYKGQAVSSALRANPGVLTAALSIHSVEARHAAEVRKIRGLKGWITNADASGLPPAIYAGEDNVVQGGIDVTTISQITVNQITEAFDEPLSMNQVLTIASPFIVS